MQYPVCPTCFRAHEDALRRGCAKELEEVSELDVEPETRAELVEMYKSELQADLEEYRERCDLWRDAVLRV